MQVNGYWNNALLVESFDFPYCLYWVQTTFVKTTKQQQQKQKQVKKRNRRCRKCSCSCFSLFSSLGRVRHMTTFLCSLFFLASEECVISCKTDNVTRSWCRGQQALETGNWVTRHSCHRRNNVLFNFLFHHMCLLEFLWLSHKRWQNHKHRNHKKIYVYMLFAGWEVRVPVGRSECRPGGQSAGQEVRVSAGRSECPRSWMRPSACGLGLYSRPSAQFFPIRTDLGQQITCLFFSSVEYFVRSFWVEFSLQPFSICFCFLKERFPRLENKVHFRYDSCRYLNP